MKTLLITILLLAGAQATPGLHAEVFEFTVRHHHTLRDCRGNLKITDAGIEFQASEANDTRTWGYEEIHAISVASPTRIVLLTYEDQRRFMGRDRAFEFTLVEGKITGNLTAMLLSRVSKPMALAVLPEYGKPAYEVRVKHLHTLGGVLGALRIYPDRVVFQASGEGDSRVWRMSDIQRFGHPDRFRFLIAGYVPKSGGPTEVYNFQLLEDLPEGLYDYLWVRRYPSSYYPPVKTEP